jgi:hypothetical protein
VSFLDSFPHLLGCIPNLRMQGVGATVPKADQSTRALHTPVRWTVDTLHKWQPRSLGLLPRSGLLLGQNDKNPGLGTGAPFGAVRCAGYRGGSCGGGTCPRGSFLWQCYLFRSAAFVASQISGTWCQAGAENRARQGGVGVKREPGPHQVNPVRPRALQNSGRVGVYILNGRPAHIPGPRNAHTSITPPDLIGLMQT